MSKASDLPVNLYAFAASLAVDRMQSGNPHEHMSYIGEDAEEGQEQWSKTASALRAMVVDAFAEAQLLEGNPVSDEDKLHLTFAVGFMFGRAFEETQILKLDGTGDLAVG